ncbi:RHS repeat domain-containing protein, partial [Rhizobacter sp. Root16D2]|uniref:RHS repeat domain-containing protein n=2 Tax=unclassified Rhizobacter TaxID=2640088 RepID=UPI0026F43A74
AIAYDPNGNRTSVSLNGIPSTYNTEATSNRLSSITNPARSFGYDNAGNTTSDSAAYTATYGLNGSIASITKVGVTGSYDYDASRRRIRKVTSGEVVVFVYDLEGQLLGEYDQTGQAIREYVWLDNIPVAMFMPDPANASGPPLIAYIHADHLNAPRVVVDTSNRVRWHWLAEPFGTTAPANNPSGLGIFTQNLRFPGQYADAESGLWYNYFRYYESGEGRYIQSDPIGFSAGDLSLYYYVGGNPLTYADTAGLAKIVGRPDGFQEGLAWARKYKDLFAYNDLMRKRIIAQCKNDGGKVLRRFDNWVIKIDPNIDDPLRRARENFAITNYSSQTSQFNLAFFNTVATDPGQGLIFAHEFRHLMPGNHTINGSSTLGSVLSGQSGKSPAEQDADSWAKEFLRGACTCESQ